MSPADPDLDAEAIESLFARGVTDGLPVVPPTRRLVERAVAASGRDAGELVALVPPNYGRATVEKIAINAVMAGCRPEYLPVVIAAVEAVCDEAFDLHGVSATTNAPAPLVVVKGPLRGALDINCGAGVFGPGWRANATIGRALRLVCVNVGRAGRRQHVHARPPGALHLLHRRAGGGEPLGVALRRARIRPGRLDGRRPRCRRAPGGLRPPVADAGGSAGDARGEHGRRLPPQDDALGGHAARPLAGAREDPG